MKTKTKTKTLLAIGLMVALWAGFLVGINLDNSKPYQADLAGTIGKVEKYRKIQMTPKDIQLRSELVKDTAKLKSLIQGLVCFSVFTEEVCTNIELAIITFRAKGLGAVAGEARQISALQDYSDFIRNNNQTLNSTVAMLSGIYSNDSAKQSQDVEKNLRDFAAYVDQLNEKNSVLNQALVSLDDFILNNKALQARKTEIARLKSIRDQLLVKGIQLGAILQNKKQLNSLIVYLFAAQEQYKTTAMDQLKLEEIVARPYLLDNVSRDVIGKIIDRETVTASSGYPDLNGLELVYDKPDGLFIVVEAQEKLNYEILATDDLKTICAAGTDHLYVSLDVVEIEHIIASQVYKFIEQQLFVVLALDNLSQSLALSAGVNELLRVESDK